MKIRTGNFANLKKYKNANYEPISIALSARYFNGQSYKKLSPRWDFKDDAPEEYIRKYNEILDSLSAEKVYIDLMSMSNNKDIVLLCHEKAGDFCHRHLVASWLEKELNIEIFELGKMDNIELTLF